MILKLSFGSRASSCLKPFFSMRMTVVPAASASAVAGLREGVARFDDVKHALPAVRADAVNFHRAGDDEEEAARWLAFAENDLTLPVFLADGGRLQGVEF
jgi:hypothetical protein